MLSVQKAELQKAAYDIRTRSVCMVTAAQWGHIGGSLSLAEMLATLYGLHLHKDRNGMPQDRVVLSKAHCSPAFYSALSLHGYIEEEALWRYCREDGPDGHLERGQYPGVITSGGSLGTGLSTAVGMAMALRMKGNTANRVYVITGDGELQEGQNWEAMMAAAQYHLDNLIVIIDYNKVQAKGFVYEEIGLEPLRDKARSFGFDVYECDGHSIEEIDEALARARNASRCGRPACVISHSVKGKGLDECEFNCLWHTHPPKAEEAGLFLRELALRYGYPPAALPVDIRDEHQNSLRAGMEEEA